MMHQQPPPLPQQQQPQQQQQWPAMPAMPAPAAIPQPAYYQQQPMQYQQYQQPMQYQQYQQPIAVPPSYPQQQQQQQAGGGSEVRTLWIGELQYWMDESYLFTCFSQTGEVVTTKVIRNKQTQQSDGYGFVEFASHASAERVLQTYNGQMMPNVDQVFRLNWASNGAGDKRTDFGSDYTIFVGDLAADVTDFMLQETFKSRYPSVKGANVVIDKLTQRSKGYGFVKFGDSNEQTRAMTEMNGVYCSTRPMRIGAAAANKKNFGSQQQYSSNASYQSSQGGESENDPNNTTIFVGGLDPNVSEDLLRQVFSPYGELVYVKIPAGKRCGFVQFANRASAEEALKLLNGTLVGGQNIRLSWGRSPTNKQQPQQESNNWNGNYYGYSQTHDAYGHAPPQDPNLYGYAAYPGYSNYPQQQPPAPPTQ